MKISPERIVVLSCHTDDAEVSSGGTIARFLREKRGVHVLALSLAAGASIDEFHSAMRSMKVTDCAFADFPVRRFSEHRQEILEALISAKKSLQPDLVIAPSLRDAHQDHQVVAQEALRAFKNGCTILGWVYPWNITTYNTTAFIQFTEEDLERKIAAIGEYRSQRKPYMEPEIIRAWALTSGVAVGARYAESFEVVRWIV